MAVKAFLPSKIVNIWGRGHVQMKLPKQTPWGDQLSALLGGNALICAVDVAMPAESV